MNYSEAIEYIHLIPKFIRPLGNENLGKLLDIMGNPQKRLKFVHVAGTNGKGSVCAMTAEILKRAGYKTGLFTSPFIVVFNERIQINNELIPDDVLAEYVSEISGLMKANDAQVSEFAFIFAVAMKYFADMECDIVVLETGMGGRLDATNIIPSPEAAVLTEIGMDHMQYLGDTVEEIAAEKCGIIKPGCEVVSAINEHVRDIIKKAAEQAGANLTICEKAGRKPGSFIYKTWGYHIALKGAYQAENASIVLETTEALRRKGWKIQASAASEGFKNVKWKARYEFLADNIVVDGAHNIDGIRALKEALSEEDREIILVLAMMKDKAYEECIAEIAQAARCVIASQLDMPRALAADEIKAVVDSTGIECIAELDVEKALDTALDLAGEKRLICICGSLYLAGDAERILKEKGIFAF
ncbi:MAG: bifunctional folylpolyglutamate synthase/dihydrofolate synthase [Oscillospiraceae bacterium]|nr:bifunctional folylpolyglutamate synthase/dihydrofolate synthase [Oscillospiraceae bacterium]